MQASTSTDVLILGGGMAGALLGASLAHTNLSITMVDRLAKPTMPTGDAATRVSALNMASQALLRGCGAWQHIPEGRLCAYTDMVVRDAEATGLVAFSCRMTDTTELGWIVENDAVTAALYQQIEEATQVRWMAEAAVTDLVFHKDNWHAVLADGSQIQASLLVGADGARSLVRQATGIHASTKDSGHVALVARLASTQSHNGYARQWFRQSGPLALLPLFGDGHQCALVWSLWPSEANRLRELEDAAFAREVTDASEGMLGELSVLGGRAAFPIHEQHVSSYYADKAVLLGDAAHVIHPLAGQGINLGMLDAGVLAEEIHRALGRGLPCWHTMVLARYQRRRRLHNNIMLHAMRGMKNLFETSAPPLLLARNSGMSLVNRSHLIKRLLARQALGLAGDVPQPISQPALNAGTPAT